MTYPGLPPSLHYTDEPNVRLGFPLLSERQVPRFEGFHLARLPKVLQE